jgi:Fe-S cluster biogenesis protein NfuA
MEGSRIPAAPRTEEVGAQEPIAKQSIIIKERATGEEKGRGTPERNRFRGGAAEEAVNGPGDSGFAVDIPVPHPIVPETLTLRKGVEVMEEQVKKALDQVRGSLQADGGDVEFVEITDDGVVRVRLVGSCAGCPMSQMTLKQGIERYLKSQIPEVKEVVSV